MAATITVTVQVNEDTDKVTLTMDDNDARLLALCVRIAREHFEDVAKLLRAKTPRIAEQFDRQAAEAGVFETLLVKEGF